MKIVGFCGSPRKGGNTDVVLSEFLRGAESAGATVEKIYLNDLNLRPCQACDCCKTEGAYTGCVLPDDMSALYDKLIASDGFMVGCPVYCFGPSAQAKTFIDRWYALSYIEAGKYQSVIRGKKMAIALLYGDRNPFTSGAMNAYAMLRDEAEWCELELSGVIYGSASDPGEIRHNSQVMAEAFELGRRLAQAATI